MAPEDIRLKLLENGYIPVPCAGKDVHLKGWTSREPTVLEVKHWTPTRPAETNTGIVTRRTPGFDIDILDPEAATAVEALVRERFEERGFVLPRFGRAPKRCIPFRTDAPFPKIAVNLIPPGVDPNDQKMWEKLELLADGQQFVAYGIHPLTNKEYSWYGGGPLEIKREELPYIHAEEAQVLVDDAVALLVERFGYREAPTGRSRPGNGAGAEAHQAGADWQCLFDNIREGRSLHDSLRGLAAKMIKAGTHAGAVVNQLRALMELSAAAHDDRWRERFAEIPRLVDSAAEKLAAATSEDDPRELHSLLKESTPPLPFPIDDLGDVLGPAASAIAAKVQCAPAMAAQSVLSVASLAAQGLVDVLLPYGQTRPVSLFALTIAESGDRKTSTDSEAMIPVKMREKKLDETFKVRREIHAIDSSAWRAQHNQIERSKMERAERVAKLNDLGSEPEPPVKPYLTIGEGTAEGLAKLMPELPGSLGIFSAEGSQFLSGYGFGPDTKLRTAASFSELWDGKGFRRARAGAGLICLPGRRLAAHLMIQPETAQSVLTDPVLRNQGLLSRFLIAAPLSLAGARMWKEPPEGLERALGRYTARVLAIFEEPQLAANIQGNELTPRVLSLSPEAREIWIAFHNEIELDMGKGQRFAEMRDDAGKAAEQAARIAGVLAIVDNANAESIIGETMARACRLMRWYLSEALRLADEYHVPQEIADAQTILEWTRARRLQQVDAATLQRIGPGPLRRKERMDPAIDELVSSGWFKPDGTAPGKARRWRVAQ